MKPPAAVSVQMPPCRHGAAAHAGTELRGSGDGEGGAGAGVAGVVVVEVAVVEVTSTGSSLESHLLPVKPAAQSHRKLRG